MEKSTEISDSLSRTRFAFLWTHILRAPFWAIYNLLLFILYKDLEATPLQIALFIALKPIVSIFSIYWSSSVHKRPDRLLRNIVWAGVIGYLPFLLFPLLYSAWFVIFASALFMMMHRGVVPAWMEIFKLNVPDGSKQRIFSMGSITSYVIGAVLPLIIGPLLDRYYLSSRWIFFATAFLGIGAIWVQFTIPIKLSPKRHIPEGDHPLFAPWKSSWHLIKSRPDFRMYQIGFMLFGGCGLMILQPALPCFFIDKLHLSYTELSIALTLCKGVGFVLTSQLWAKAMGKTNIFRFSGLIALLGAFFPLILLASQWQLLFVYLAYIVYGVMQAGSELSWHLSGPLFSGEEESSAYSTVNVLAVGLRGSFIPHLGSYLCLLVSPAAILCLGASFLLAGAGYLTLSQGSSKKGLAKNLNS